MKFAKSQDLKLLYWCAEVNSPSKARIIDMPRAMSPQLNTFKYYAETEIQILI